MYKINNKILNKAILLFKITKTMKSNKYQFYSNHKWKNRRYKQMRQQFIRKIIILFKLIYLKLKLKIKNHHNP